MAPPTIPEREWARQWARAASALADVRAAELRAMTDQEALRAVDELLTLVKAVDLPPSRLVWSGLVDLQRLLHRART